MDWPKLDVRAWNLSVSLGAAALGCGGGDEPVPQDCDTDCSDDDVGVEDDCGYDYDCLPEPDEEDSGSQCPDPDDSAPCYPQCQRDADCAEAQLCNADGAPPAPNEEPGTCEPVTLLEVCDGLALSERPTGIPADGISSLAFVDLDDDPAEELLIGRTTGHVIVDGPDLAQTELLLEGAGSLENLVVDDFDGDGTPEILSLDDSGSIWRWAPSGDGTFDQTELVNPAARVLSDVSSLDWNDDGLRDLAALDLDGVALMLLGDGTGGFSDLEFLAADSVSDIAVGRFAGDARDDIVVQTSDVTQLALGGAGDLVEVTPQMRGPRRVVVADFDASGSTDLIGHTPMGTWTLIESWVDGTGAYAQAALPFEVGSARAGRVNADDVPDLVFTRAASAEPTEASFMIALGTVPDTGGAGVLECAAISGPPADLVAFGDLDGDGRIEIATVRSDAELLLWVPL
jgi:hypothetical protein